MSEQRKLSRRTLVLVGLALVSVNLGAAVMLTAEPQTKPQAVFLPDFKASLQLVSFETPSVGSHETDPSSEPARVEFPSDKLTEIAVRSTPTLSCRVWGPFSSEAKADAQVTALTEVGAREVRKQVQSQPQAPDHLVYVGPYPSRSQAKQHLAKLQKAGVDSQIILRGSLKNAISVGVFGRQRAASRQQKAVEAIGFKVLRRELERASTVHLVKADIDPANPAHLGASKSEPVACEASRTEIASAT